MIRLAIAMAMTTALCQGAVYTAPPNQSGGTDMNASQVADNFVLVAPLQITTIQFWALQGSVADYSGSIVWSINQNAGGVPGAVLLSGTATPAAVATGLSAFGLNEFSYTFGVSGSLAAGTYWLTLHNGPLATIPSTTMFWEDSNSNSGNSQTVDLALGNQPWVANFSSLAFSIDGTAPTATPEPSAVILFGSGLLALVAKSRRKQ